MGHNLIVHSFEIAAERCEDLTPLVYARLFREQPDLEAMFVLDTMGAARGNMLASVINALLDRVGDDRYGDNMIQAEALNHAGIGVAPEQFSRFFGIIAETLADVLGANWTPEMARAWQTLLSDLDRVVTAPG